MKTPSWESMQVFCGKCLFYIYSSILCPWTIQWNPPDGSDRVPVQYGSSSITDVCLCLFNKEEKTYVSDVHLAFNNPKVIIYNQTNGSTKIITVFTNIKRYMLYTSSFDWHLQ